MSRELLSSYLIEEREDNLPLLGLDCMTGFVRAVGDEKDRTLEFIGSTEDVDRYQEVITVKGWDLRMYRLNPIFLFGHNYREPSIGKALRVWKDPGAEKGGTGDKPTLRFHIRFATAEEYAFADTIYRLFRGGFMRATSVGFLPHSWEEPKEDGEGELSGHKPKKKPRRIYTGQELLELSGVPVPANPFALGNAIKKGMITDVQLREMRDRVTMPAQELWKSLKPEVIELSGWSEACAKRKEEVGTDETPWAEGYTIEIIESPEGRVVIPFEVHGPGLPVQDPTMPWEHNHQVALWREAVGGPDEGTMDFERYAQMFAYQVPGSLENRDPSGFKFAHHDATDGVLWFHWLGIATAMGQLLARWEPWLSEFLARGVYAHLRQEYVVYEQIAPEFRKYETVEHILEGVHDKDTAHALYNELFGETKAEELPEEMRTKWPEFGKQEEPEEERTVIGFGTHGDLPSVPIEQRWQGTVQERRWRSAVGGPDTEEMNFRRYAQMFAWREPDAITERTLGGFKLPHHGVTNGRLQHHFRGAVAAMAALLGARGGVDVPRNERRGIYNHLAREYAKYDREPPEFREYNDLQDILTAAQDGDSAHALYNEIFGETATDNLPMEILGEWPELLEVKLVDIPDEDEEPSGEEPWFDEDEGHDEVKDVLEFLKQQAKQIQSLILSKRRFKDQTAAVAWLKENEFRSDKIDDTPNTFRARQFDPGRCKDNSFATISLTSGVRAVICAKKTIIIEATRDPDGNLLVLMSPEFLEMIQEAAPDHQVEVKEDSLLDLEWVVEKAGAVLNKRNMARVKQISDLAIQVLEEAEPAIEKPEELAKGAEEEEVVLELGDETRAPAPSEKEEDPGEVIVEVDPDELAEATRQGVHQAFRSVTGDVTQYRRKQ